MTVIMGYGPDVKTRECQQTEPEGRKGLPYHDSLVARSQEMHMFARKAEVPCCPSVCALCAAMTRMFPQLILLSILPTFRTVFAFFLKLALVAHVCLNYRFAQYFNLIC